MRPSSTICNVCKRILNTPIEEPPRFWPYADIPIHHKTLESFENAVAQGCNVCSSLWQRLEEKIRNGWLSNRSTWQPISCHSAWYKGRGSGVIIVFVIFNGHVHFRQRYFLFPMDDESCTEVFATPSLGASTGSLQTLETIKSWYLSCHATHSYCKNFVQSAPWCPTRLLYIGLEGDTEWELHLPSERGFTPPKYITLSYRWGSNQKFQLTDRKLKKGFRGRIQDLPTTFKHAIHVARQLSVQYLWIDRLCIVQDSQVDWEYESRTMRDVYTNSLCTIAASASHDPNGGLFRSRDPEDLRPILVVAKFDMTGKKYYYMTEEDYYDHGVTNNPLQKRGWVFQERLLAQRTVHFTEKQVFWECAEETKCEARRRKGYWDTLRFYGRGWKDLELNKSTQEPGCSKAYDLWDALVQSYTKRDLTRESDRLVAFSGVAQLFQGLIDDKYLAGMWRSRLEEQLCWVVYEPARRSKSEYFAPSWSWASVPGPIETRTPGKKRRIHVTVLDVGMQCKLPDDDGHSVFDYIKLSGFLFPAIYKTESDEAPLADLWDPDVLNTGLKHGRMVHCLVMSTHADLDHEGKAFTSWMGLMILEASPKRSGVYRRLGWLHIRHYESLVGLSLVDEKLVAINGFAKLSVITLV